MSDNTSKYKLEFTLKQHTPMIHFQAEQKGATLRATELKPKLDRFLIEQLKMLDEKDKPKEVYKSWFIGGGREHLALDYKVKILSDNYIYEPAEYQKKDRKGERAVNYKGKPQMATLPIFFANMGKEWNKSPKHLVHTKDEISIEIISLQKELLKKIKNCIEEFIFMGTFGTRQSKGLGSFTVESINNEKTKKILFADYVFTIDISKSIIYTPYYDSPTQYYLEMEKLFDGIKRFHQVLRGGINESVYVKPYIFYYAQSKNITWDKKTFKQAFLKSTTAPKQKKKHDTNSNDPLCYDANNKPSYLVRDLLGLSTEQLWRYSKEYDDYGFTVRHPKVKNEKFDYLNNEKISPNTIKRFKTPFTYKPVHEGEGIYSVYIILNEINPKIFNETFTILKDDKDVDDAIKDLKMWKDFNLSDFFKKEVYTYRDELKNRINHPEKKLATYCIDIFSSLEEVKS